ncbi:MAG: DNA repair protein RecN [Thermoleophilaceae bacterium]
MLLELRVENLLLIERAELALAPGLNAITGETGAGKTMLAHALDLLLGGKPRPGIVRPGAGEAYVEGVFEMPAGIFEDEALADLRERVPEGEGEIVLARRVSTGGRTRAFVQGRSATAADLTALGARLISFYGQHEHRRLTLSSAQLEILDAFCGPDQIELRAEFTAAHAGARRLAADLDSLRSRAGARERDRDLLAFELDEIDSLDPSPGDEDALRAERTRLRQLEGLRAASAGAAEALAPDGGDGAGAVAALAEAERLLGAMAGADAALDELSARVRALQIEADDLAGELRAYEGTLEAEPGRLEEIDARLDEYERLKRKHGGGIDAVLGHAQRCREDLLALERSHDDLTELEGRLAAERAREMELAGVLTKARRRGAPELSRKVLAELSQLAMEGASFAVELHERDQPGTAGAERVEFLMAPNPGVAPTPLRDTASGGEVSRVMLALLSAAGAGGATTLVFDEVDAGIGGQTARAVGERLRRLASGRQVICITHLPQVASFAARHFKIEKSAAGDLARTSVEALADSDVVGELCRMLGADVSDAGARRHAEELLALAA